MKKRKTGMKLFAGLFALAAAAATMFSGIRPAGSRADDENTVGALDAPYGSPPMILSW
jgi:hypothetical protein